MAHTEAQQIVTPVTWIEMPRRLTIDQALHLSGWSERHMRWAIAEGVVIAYDGDDDYLIDRDSLHEAMEWRAFVHAWTHAAVGSTGSKGIRPTA